MSKSDSKPRINAIFDYYETAVKNTQDIFKAMREHGEYIDLNDGNPVVRPSEGMFAVIHAINRVSFVPPIEGDEEFFLNGARLNREGKAVYSSNCHGGIMKNNTSITKMIEEFNKGMKCDGLKVKAYVVQDGTVITVPELLN